MAFSPETTRLLVVFALLLAVASSLVAVILGSVSLGRSSHNVLHVNTVSQPHADHYSDKIWTLAIGDLGVNLEYLDEENYQMKGYNVDVVNAVCELANKRCTLVYDVTQRCWDSEPGQRARGGEGLLSGWYDACTGWVKTYPRSLTFDFTRSFIKRKDVALYAKNSSTAVNYRDLTGLRVGFIDGFASDEHCLARYADSGITGAKLESSQIVHFPSGRQLIQALQNGQVDVVFAIKLPQLESSFHRLTPAEFPNHCYPDGAGMMTRKGNTEFVTWWNEAFGRLVGTQRYDDICTRLKTVHGHKPGSGPGAVCIGY